jgi:hypothetical protein
MQSFDQSVADSRRSGIAVELGRRALVRAVTGHQGTKGFANELFAEATAYYASRDIPSVVGRKGRIETPLAGIRLKAELKGLARTVASSSGSPATDPAGWERYVGRVLGGLRGGR